MHADDTTAIIKNENIKELYKPKTLSPLDEWFLDNGPKFNNLKPQKMYFHSNYVMSDTFNVMHKGQLLYIFLNL